MYAPSTIPVPLKAKLVDEEAAKKLEQRLQELKQTYRPTQGWLTAPENAIERRS